MAKSKATAFFCKECGYESAKWNGQCPSCKAWNTFVEAPVIKEEKAAGRISLDGAGRVKFAAPKKLEEIDASAEERIPTGFSELDNVLGGGIVPASLVLVGGDPGIGKSTLLLQACANIAASGRKVLYVSGEESLKQIKLRADRIGKIGGDMLFLSENNLDVIAAALQNEMPALAVIDSIQTVYRDEVSGAPGSISQVRESTSVLLQVAKGLGQYSFSKVL